jgi:xanthosine phosphorylase
MKVSDPKAAAIYIKDSLNAQGKANFTPRIGIVLGSGLGGLAEHISDPTFIPYQNLPGFPISTVPGHSGQLVLGYLEGVPVACLQGRAHYYEGATNEKIKTLIRTLKVIGCDILLGTNASGSLRPEVGAGNLMIVADHINFQGNNPLIGINDDEFGGRFVSMENAYDSALRTQLHAVAKQLNIPITEGVYLSVLGPMYETPAEIRAFRILGADAVGMSTASEVIVARHCGLRVAVVAAITNLAAGLSDEEITHEGTLHYAGKAADHMIQLVKGFVREVK